MEHKYIVALEVGSSKIRAALGDVDPEGTLTVKAVEEERLVDSVRHGVVRNVGEVAAAARNVLNRLEKREGGRQIHSAYVALGGRSTMSSPCEVERRLSTETVIGRDHINQIFTEARQTVLNDRDVMEAVPAEFLVDNQRVSKPVGAIGREVTALFNLVSTRSQLKRNLSHALEKSLGLKVKGYVVRQLAEAGLVLTPEERRLGCMLVDFGAETTTVSIYKDGYLCSLTTLPIGSRHITRDIAALNYLEEEAERLKISGGDASLTPAQSIPGGIDYTPVNEMVSARAGEIIENIRNQIKLIPGMRPADLPAGIIIIGGGARLRGFIHRLGEATDMRVRMGMPKSSIRINSSSIQPSDAIDVIALLDAVAPQAESCIEPPELKTIQTTFGDTVAETAAPGVPTIATVDAEEEEENEAEIEFPANNDENDDDLKDDDAPGSKRRNWLFGKLKEKITRLMSEDDEIDDEFADDDSEAPKHKH